MAALILIDIQMGFDSPLWGVRNNPDAEENAALLLRHWRQIDQAVIHIRHISRQENSPLSPHTGGTEFKPEVSPQSGEPIFEKSVNSAFIGTDLAAHLHNIGAKNVVICGLTTPHCVSTTTRMAANLGFSVDLAHDACAAFTTNAHTDWADLPALSAEDIHNGAVSHLHGEFATARRSRDIIAGHPA